MAENEKARCLEFLLEEAKKEVGEKQNWIDMCHDVQYTQAETLGQKSREIQRLTQENVTSRSLCCPISMELFKDPVISKQTDLSFEREDTEKWLQTNRVCP